MGFQCGPERFTETRDRATGELQDNQEQGCDDLFMIWLACNILCAFYLKIRHDYVESFNATPVTQTGGSYVIASSAQLCALG